MDFHFIIVKKTNNQIVVNWEKKLMTEYVNSGLKKMGITISKPLLAILCIIFGILVIVFPSLLVWIVGLFLVIEGILLLTGFLETSKR